MLKAERYLPFILAVFIPVFGAISGAAPLVVQDWKILIFRYIEASSILLIIWYLNQWLLYTPNKMSQLIGVNMSIIIGNLIAITSFVIIDSFLAPNGFTTHFPFWLPVIRFSMVALIFNFILRIFKSQKDQTKLEVQNLSLQAENLKFQIETFKQQINPHFLFNSLNTLLDLIEDDTDGAIKYVRNFSNLYRIVLQSSKHDFVTLAEELKFLSDYWSLLKVRFNDAIELDIHIPEDKMGHHIPPLSLQFLIENVVKHNEASKSNPLVIDILEDNGSIIVKNKIRPKTYPVASEKVGLKNLQQRFTLLHSPIQYQNDLETFIVKLPLKAT